MLTPRESEVLQLIVGGLTDREIASRLGISRSTVDAHTSMLRSKLGVKRKDQLPRAARERGLI
jgi:two-component system nitrate/nitrite response regulator NarL